MDRLTPACIADTSYDRAVRYRVAGRLALGLGFRDQSSEP